MYFYGYRQHQPHAFVNKLNIIFSAHKKLSLFMTIVAKNIMAFYD